MIVISNFCRIIYWNTVGRNPREGKKVYIYGKYICKGVGWRHELMNKWIIIVEYFIRLLQESSQ